MKGLSYVEILWGINHLSMSILLFSVFGFLWCCVDVLISGGTVSLLKHFFHNGLCFNINVTLSHLISLFMLIFFIYFCLSICEKDGLLVKYLSCKICIFLRYIGKHDMCSG